MGFKFYRFSVAFIVDVCPPVLLNLLADIDRIEVSQHALISIEASMNVQLALVHNSDMI
jgi:hypothetical protein